MLCAMLGRSPLVLLVGSSGGPSKASDRFLQLYDLSTEEPLTSIHFDNGVVAVRINDMYIAVILQRITFIFELKSMQVVHQITTETPVNRLGLGALCTTMQAKRLFVYPTSLTTGSGGDFAVLDITEKTEIRIPGHDHPLVALEVNSEATRIVTASESGTIIKVFRLPDGAQLFEFRRGTHKAVITSLAISPLGNLVAVCSDKGTVHLFRCEGDGLISQRGPTISARSFTKISMKDHPGGLSSICKFGGVDGNALFVVTGAPVLGMRTDNEAFVSPVLHHYRVEPKGHRFVNAHTLK